MVFPHIFLKYFANVEWADAQLRALGRAFNVRNVPLDCPDRDVDRFDKSSRLSLGSEALLLKRFISFFSKITKNADQRDDFDSCE